MAVLAASAGQLARQWRAQQLRQLSAAPGMRLPCGKPGRACACCVRPDNAAAAMRRASEIQPSCRAAPRPATIASGLVTRARVARCMRKNPAAGRAAAPRQRPPSEGDQSRSRLGQNTCQMSERHSRLPACPPCAHLPGQLHTRVNTPAAVWCHHTGHAHAGTGGPRCMVTARTSEQQQQFGALACPWKGACCCMPAATAWTSATPAAEQQTMHAAAAARTRDRERKRDGHRDGPPRGSGRSAEATALHSHAQPRHHLCYTRPALPAHTQPRQQKRRRQRPPAAHALTHKRARPAAAAAAAPGPAPRPARPPTQRAAVPHTVPVRPARPACCTAAASVVITTRRTLAPPWP